MNVLISGITGFVGKNLHGFLCENFPQTTVYGLVRQETKCEEIFSGTVYCLTQVDKQVLDALKIDTIIHLAGIAHDLSGKFSDQDYDKVNFGLTKYLYQEFLSSKYTSKFIFISSVKALADEVDGVLTEDVPPTPGTPYGKSKLKAEQFIQSHPTNNKSSYILRPAMVYGPENKGNLNTLYKFIDKGYPYPFGSFENKRSFLSVNNLSFIISNILQDKVAPGDYNCSDSSDLSSVELVQLIAKTLNKRRAILNVNTTFINMMASIGSILHLPFNKQVLNKLTGSYRVSSKKILDALKIEEFPFKLEDEIVKTIESFEKY